MIFIHNFLACCVIPHTTKWTLYPFTPLFFLASSEYNPSQELQTSSLFCALFFPLYKGYGRYGLFCLPRQRKYLCRRIVSGHPMSCFGHRKLKCILDDIFVYYHLKSFQPHCHLDLCFQWQEMEQLLHLEIASLLKWNMPVFVKLLHTVADWKAPQ